MATFKQNKFLEWLGFKILNTKTLEYHNPKNLHYNCRIKLLSKANGRYISSGGLRKLIKKNPDLGINGCRWCSKSTDKG